MRIGGRGHGQPGLLVRERAVWCGNGGMQYLFAVV